MKRSLISQPGAADTERENSNATHHKRIFDITSAGLSFPDSEHSCPVIYALVRNILTLPHITEFLKNTRARAGKNVNIWMPKTKPTGHLASFETVEDALRGFL